MNIIQIGANRGNDDLSSIIGKTQPTKLVLVEPVKLHNTALLNYYSWVKNINMIIKFNVFSSFFFNS